MPVRYLSNVTTLTLDQDKCTGCGMCAIVCPHRVFRMENNKAAVVDKDLCMECGACMMNCAFDAITVRKGVGCAFAILRGKLRGTEPECGCSEPAKTSAACSCGNAESETAGCCGSGSKGTSCCG